MAVAGVTLTRYESTTVDYRWAGAYRIRVVASDAVGGLPPEIFLYHRKPLNPHTGGHDDVFVGVASPVEVADYPVGTPRDDLPYLYFRLAYFEIDLPAAQQAETVWEETVEQAATLCRAFDALTELRERSTARVGAPSGSASSSA